MITKEATAIPGCYVLQTDVLHDERGGFIKTFHTEMFEELDLPTAYGEEYCSTSRQGVLRGLHFQLPPKAHAKLIYCSVGEIYDVAVDLRKASPTFGKYAAVRLSGERGNMVFVPIGCAHGFYTLSEKAVIVCKQTSVYAQEQDAGIRWDSVGIQWPGKTPILSEKDRRQIPFAAFESPF